LRQGRFGIDLADPAHCADPETAMFIDQHVELAADPAVPRGGVRVTLTTQGGDTADVLQEHALGTPQYPATRAQVEGKFLLGAAARLGPALSGELLAELSELDRVADCAELIRRSRQVNSGCADAAHPAASR
jgi:2-methylcitrate dehydratase PrpD